MSSGHPGYQPQPWVVPQYAGVGELDPFQSLSGPRAALRIVVRTGLHFMCIGWLGSIWMLWDPHARTWQDMASGSRVVKFARLPSQPVMGYGSAPPPATTHPPPQHPAPSAPPQPPPGKPPTQQSVRDWRPREGSQAELQGPKLGRGRRPRRRCQFGPCVGRAGSIEHFGFH